MANAHTHGPHAHGTAPRGGQDHATTRRLLIAIAITATLVVVELAGAAYTNSLALLADAGHMATDVAALAIALLANWLAGKPHSATRSYGSIRAEILAALANGIGLLAIAMYIFAEGVGRLGAPPAVEGGPMLAIAAAGLVANMVAARVLMKGAGSNLNFRGAFVHMLSDVVNNAGVLVAAVLVLAFGWYLADPLVSMAVGVMLLIMAVRLVKPAVHILLEATPRDLNLDRLEQSILGQSGVLQVHDLHAWTLSSGYNAVTAHVVVSETILPGERERVLDGLRHMIPDHFPVRHLTLQLEESTECCEETHMPGVVMLGCREKPIHPHGKHPLAGHKD